MAGKERNTKFWQRKFNYRHGEKIATITPNFILKKGSGWRKITKAEDVLELFPPFVANSLANDIDLYNVWVHESDGAFGRGVYEKFIESAKSQLKDKYKTILFDAGINKTHKVSWFLIKELIEKELKIEVKENYADGCVDFTDEVLKEIEESESKKLKKK